MTILVISNMGAKASAPFQGIFVDKQVQKLSELLPQIQYYNLKWNGDTLLHKMFKYPFFFIYFVFKYIFSFKRIDVIHVHYYFPTIICAMLYKIFRNYKVKIIVTCHGSDVYCYSSPHFFYRQCAKVVDCWLFTSKQLQSKFFKKVNNSQVLSAGYDDAVFKYNDNNTQKEIDFLLVASLDFNKGLDRLFYLVKAFPNKKFALVGNGPLLNQVNNVLKKFSNLQYLGVLNAEELVAIYQKSQYLLSLSRNESFGLVITEAAACGVPCIATETDGVIEQLSNWPFIVKQMNRSEESVLIELKKMIYQTSSLTAVEYSTLTKNVINNSKKHSLNQVISILIKLYKSLDIKPEVHSDV